METIENIQIRKKELRCCKDDFLADTLTPVSAYLRVRDRFPKSILLESSDYSGKENSLSYLCFGERDTFLFDGENVQLSGTDTLQVPVSHPSALIDQFDLFRNSFKVDGEPTDAGLFGYISFDLSSFLNQIQPSVLSRKEEIPLMRYSFYRYILRIDHFQNRATLVEFLSEGEDSELASVKNLLLNGRMSLHSVSVSRDETAALSAEEFLDRVEIARNHCRRGDVFQLVLSRRFSRTFTGDDFKIYRSLRSVNPSPYLFYFDLGDFRLLGSSPETELKITDRKAEIHPIAGTFKRSGSDSEDQRLADLLMKDPKENAEHVMLVDLARNDLSIHGDNVKVESFREVQYYSHVIHLVSKVTADLSSDTSSMAVAFDTFPAGTLSGAPKRKALELIAEYEPHGRGFYGGCVGYVGLNGDFNHAIMIRTLFSKDNEIHYQAGAGIVVDSVPEKELAEVDNKLGAIRKALQLIIEQEAYEKV